MIRYTTEAFAYPTIETEGILLTDEAVGTGESRSATHEGLVWNTTYRYSAFSYDGSSNYSSAATASATSTDLLPPTVEVFTPNGGELYAGGSVHDITWEAIENGNSGFGSTPITIYFTTNEGTSWTFITQEANSGSYNWTIPTGIYSTQCRVSIEAEDNAGNVGSDESDADFTIDGVSPEVSSIALYDRTTGDTDRTNEQTITVEAFGVSSDAIEMMVSNEASFAGATWESFVATFEYTLPAGDGTKEVYFKVRDAVSLESSPVSNSIILDTAGPTDTSITINNDAYATNEVSVELTLAATDEWAPLEMLISNEASFAGAVWEPFSTSKAWTLFTGDGTKEVYAKFRDGGGNTSEAVSDTIILDTVDPTVEVSSPDGGEVWIGGSNHNITWTATDEGSGFGVTPIVIWFTSDEGASWQYITTEANDGSYSWTVPTIDSTQCRVSIEATDLALNTGRDMSASTFTIDSTSPEVASITLYDRTTGNTDRTNEQTISVEAFGVSGDVVEMLVSSEASFAGASWQSFTATFEYTLPAGDGTKEVYFKVRDAALQESNTVNDSIILDTTGPTDTGITINNDDPYTNEVNVELTLTATDEWVPVEMIVSNEATFSGANWESFSASKTWTLLSGDGTKTVYAMFRDGGGNTSEAVSDTIILDTVDPTVEVSSPDGGEVWIGGTGHDITWTATDEGSGFGATPIVIWFTSDEGASWQYITTEVNDGSYSWTVPTIDSTQCRVSIEATDLALNTGRDMSAATFTIDSTSPEVASITLYDRTTGDTDRTNEQTISVEAFGVSGDAIEMMVSSEASFAGVSWQSFTGTFEFTLPAGDGTKEVYFKVRDAASQESNVVSDSIILDTAGPTDTSITINNDAYATNEVSVELTLAATDEWAPLEMLISNEASFAGAAWEPFSTSRAWTLFTGDGTKEVYAKFRDGGGNTSEAVNDDIILDTVPPTVEVTAPDGGEVWIGGSSHDITWTATDEGSGFGATPIVIWFTSNEGASWEYVTTEANDGSYSWTVPTIDSTQCRISVEATDQALNTGRDMSAATFTIDSTSPEVASITLYDRTTGDTDRTNEQTISVEAFGVSGDAIEMMVSSEASFAGASWQSFTGTFEFTLPAGDGTKEVYFKVRDAASQESNVVSDSIILDTTGPTSTSISINNDAYATNEVSVTLTLTATDEWTPLEMLISNEASFAGAVWEPFSTSRAWTLFTGDGTKEVYAKFRDGGSNESTPVFDTIILDTVDPTVEISSPDGGEVWIGGTSHDITWTATDEGSGFGATPIVIWFTSNDGGSWSYVTAEANDGSYLWTAPTIDSTQCRISIEATDQAQNTGRDMSAATFTIDSTPPSVTSIEVVDRDTGDPIRTNERPVSVEAFGVSGDAVQMRLAENSTFTANETPWITYEANYEYTLSIGDGNKTVYFKVRDAAFQESNVVSNSIILDTTGPTGTITINNNDPYTNEVNVELTLTATDEWVPIMMNISNEASFPAANWESFSATKAWALTAGDGTKTVYAKFRDGGSNETVSSVSDDILLDTTPPTVEVNSPDGGENWAGGSVQNITWTASDSGSGFGAAPIVIWFTSSEGTTWNYVTTETNSGSYSWTVPTIDSTQCRISIEATDQAQNTGRDMSDATFSIDSTPPVVTSIEARDRTSGNPIRSNELAISVEAFGVSGGPSEMRLAQDASFTVNSTGWKAYSANTEYTFSVGEGSRTVYYQVRDSLLFESNVVSDSIIIDTTGPTGTIAINNDDPYTNEVNVELTLTATDEWTPIMMNISNEASFPAANWESFSATKAWALTAGDGTKMVYAMFRDGGGNTSEAVNDDIILDTLAPTVEVISPNGGEPPWIGGSQHYITWNANDSGSGFGTTPIILRYSSNEGNSWIFINQVANTGSYLWTLPGITSDECRVSVEAIDRALNIGTDASDANFTIDSTVPIVTSIEARDRTTGSSQRTNDPTVTVEAYGVLGAPTKMIMAQNADFTQNSTGWLSYSATTEYTFSSGDGLRDIYYKLRNAGLTESSTVSASIILDTTGPILTSISINGGMAITNETGVILTLTATDEWPPIQMMISHEASFAGGIWEPYGQAKNWELTGGDGTKTLYVKYRDGGYNESSPEGASIILDTTSPEVVDNKPVGINVSVDTTVEVFFSEDMDKGSAQAAFSISPQASGSFSWVGNAQMIFTPAAPLNRGVNYEIQISDAARDPVGNRLSPAPFIWQFQTEPDNIPPTIDNYMIGGARPLPGDFIEPVPTITANIKDEGSAARIHLIQILANTDIIYEGTDQNWGNAEFMIGGPDDGNFEYTLENELAVGTYNLLIRAEDFAGNAADKVYENLKVAEPGLAGPVLNFPNPFAPLSGEKTNISYYLTRNKTMAIYIYDIRGSLVWKKTCVAGEETYPGSGVGCGGRVGYNEVVFDGYSAFREVIPNGIYIVRVVDVTAKKVLGTGKITVLDKGAGK